LPGDESKQIQEAHDARHMQSSLQHDGKSCSSVSSETTISHYSCIWDSSDIEVLRRIFKTTSNENMHLHSQVCVLQADIDKMTAERCAQSKVLESTQQCLYKAETANKRLQMLVSHLKTELYQTTKAFNSLQLAEAERNDLSRQLQKTQLELLAARCQRDRDVAATEAKWQIELEEQRLADVMAKTQLSGELTRLVDRVEDLQQQLHQETASHSQTRQGLDHLRIHFSSLSTSGEKTNNMHNNELVNWTY